MDYKPPMEPYLDILFEDDSLLVLNKQSGLLSVPGRLLENKDSIQLRAISHCEKALTVHRLDMETSGVIVMAKSKNCHRELSRQFQDRETEKHYKAIIGGVLDADGKVDFPLRCDWPNRPRQMVDHELGKKALTHYKVLDHTDGSTRVQLIPVTGRSHQLRVHMQAIGHPILGDPLYATGKVLKAASRLLLHAESLTLSHPVTAERLCFSAPVPF